MYTRHNYRLLALLFSLITLFAISLRSVSAHNGVVHLPTGEEEPPNPPQEEPIDLTDHAQLDEYWIEQAKDAQPFDVDAARSRIAVLPSYIGGEWGPIIQWPHVPATASNLPDGRILTFASNRKTSFPSGRPEQTYTATWDPETNTFDEIFYEGHDMFCGHPVMLENGLMMVSGGRNAADSPWTSTFDYRTNSWSAQQEMNYGRWYPTSIALPDGGVFIGTGTGGQNTAEIWDPVDGWRVLSNINFAPLSNVGAHEDNNWPFFQVAPDGDIEQIGPHHDMHTITTSGNGSFTYSGEFDDTWYPNSGGMVYFEAGKALVFGGTNSYNNTNASYHASVVDMNGATPVVTDQSDMHRNRNYGNAVMLPTGDVLAIGGKGEFARFDDTAAHLEAESWNPDTGNWTLLNAMNVPRTYHSVALLLTDGTVLSAGGGLCNCSADHPDAQIYYPPYLFEPDGSLAARPTIATAPSLVTTGQTIDVIATDGMAKFSLIKMSATTHAVNTDLRFLNVPFVESAAGQYELSLHNNINVLSPGYWMLFAVDDSGVPSEAAVLQVKQPSQPLANLALGRSTSQSSTQPSSNDYDSENAVDGNLNGDAAGKSLARTESEAEAWWEVDLGAVNAIDTISLFNRTDCCANRLSNFHVFVSDVPFTSQSVNGTQAQAGVSDFAFPGTAGRQTDFAINRMGRYVRVQLDGTNSLQLAEVQIFGGGMASNAPPIITAIDNQVTELNSTVSLAINAFDPNSDPLTFSATDLPTGLQIDSNTGVIVGTVSALGTYQPTVTVSDGEGGSTDAQFTWRVMSCLPIVFDAGTIQSYGGGQDQGQFTILNNGLSIRIVDNGWKAIPLPETISADSVIEFDFRSTIEGEEHLIGFDNDLSLSSSHRFKLYGTQTNTGSNLDFNSYNGSGNDQHFVIPIGQYFTGSINYLVLNADHDASPHNGESIFSNIVLRHGETSNGCQPAPVITNPGNQTNIEGDSVTLPIVADDLDNDPLTFSATGLPTNLSINGTTGVINGTVTTVGAYNVTVSVEDSDGAMDSANFTWTVQAADDLVVTTPTTTPHSTGTAVTWQADASGGNGTLRYKWLFGDGSAETPYSTDPNISHTYTTPGRYSVQLTVNDGSGQTKSVLFYQAIHEPLTSVAPVNSSSIVQDSADRVWIANPDNNTVSVFDANAHTKLAEIAVGESPRTLAQAPNGNLWVVNKTAATISVIDDATLTVLNTIALPYASQPHGLLFAPDGSSAFVTLEARGELQKLDPATGATLATLAVGDNPRHLSISGDSSTLYVARFITPPLPGEATANVQTNAGGGEVLAIDPATLAIEDTLILEHSDLPDTALVGGGLPNYLQAPIIAPSGLSAWVPSKQDNITRGILRNGQELVFDQAVRAITSKINLVDGSETYLDRINHDNAGVASAATFGPYGNYLFVALETNQSVAVVDPYLGEEIGRFPVGRAPQGITLSADGNRLYVHNFMDRSVSVIDISPLIATGQQMYTTVATWDSVANELLSAEVLNGKQLFYDASDDRLALDNYMSCASCHNDAGDDGRVWDFTGVGEGLRNTASLLGHGNQGMLHWSGNFDEFQDFEAQIRAFAGGTGLMADAEFNSGTISQPLGDPKSGLSADLDALAAYMQSLSSVDNSPHRQSSGELTTAGVAGEDVYIQHGCAICHSGTEFTDSAFDVRHDVGTITVASGQRLGGTLDGFDTPTLRGLWRTAPYLHDGSAATLGDAVNAHNDINITGGDLANLVAFLQQVDDNSAVVGHLASFPAVSCAPQQNGLLYERWDGIAGVDIASLTSHANYPDNPSSTTYLTDLFEAPSNAGSEFGTRVRGYIVPPLTGNYTFWIASDDHGSLLLSSDDDPANAVEIAFVAEWGPPRVWDWAASQQSAPITLQAGQRYYIEALAKEQGGGDNLAVAWALDGQAIELIASNVLCAYEPTVSAPTAHIAASVTTGDAPLTVSLSGAGSADPDNDIVSYAWTFGDGTTSSVANPPDKTYTDAGSYVVRLTVTDSGGRSDSAETTIVVTQPQQAGCGTYGLHRSIWTEVWSGEVRDLQAHFDYPDNPDSTETITAFIVPTNADDLYGSRMVGYLVAPETGSYTFYVASDNEGQLWLSSDINPSNATMIAQTYWSPEQGWFYNTTQRSASIDLIEGELYYIEGLHQTSWGSDYFAVAWQTPSGGNAAPQIISGDALCQTLGGVALVRPTARIVTDVTQGTDPLTVSFDGSTSSDADGTIVSYAWTFGDGSTSSAITPPPKVFAAGTYNVTLTVVDNDGKSDSAETTITVDSSPPNGGTCDTQGVHRDIWTEVWSGQVADLVNDARYPDNPTSTETLSTLQVPTNAADGYGSRMQAYLIAPVTGSYTFWVASDNEGQLWLSSDNTPDNVTMIAQTSWSPELGWDYSSSQQSAPIQLTAGEAYYIEGLHQTSWGSDYYAVAWQPPNGARELIPANALCLYGAGTVGDAARQATVNTTSSLVNANIVRSFPVNLYPELLGMMTRDEAMRTEAMRLKGEFEMLLANGQIVPSQFVTEFGVLWDDVYGQASAEMRLWMEAQIKRGDLHMFNDMPAENVWAIINGQSVTTVPTSLGLKSVVTAYPVLWAAMLLPLLLGVTLYLLGSRRRKPRAS